MLADLNPKPDQVTLAINTNQMNVMELIGPDDYASTSMGEPAYFEAYREMTYTAGPTFVEEHLKRLQARHSAIYAGRVGQFETVGASFRSGVYRAIDVNWVAIGGGLGGPNLYDGVH